METRSHSVSVLIGGGPRESVSPREDTQDGASEPGKASPGAGLVSTSSSDFQTPKNVCCFSLQATGLPQWLSRPSRPTPGVLGDQEPRSTSCPVVPKPQQPGRPGQPFSPTGVPAGSSPQLQGWGQPGPLPQPSLAPSGLALPQTGLLPVPHHPHQAWLPRLLALQEVCWLSLYMKRQPSGWTLNP